MKCVIDDKILSGIGTRQVCGSAGAVTIAGVTSDSRGVKPGDAFVAISGTKVDGHAFIFDAIRAGADARGAPAAGAGGPAVPVVVGTVEQKTVPVYSEWTARTDANDSVEIRARVKAVDEGRATSVSLDDLRREMGGRFGA